MSTIPRPTASASSTRPSSLCRSFEASSSRCATASRSRDESSPKSPRRVPMAPPSDLLDRFRKLQEGGGGQPDLFEGALLIAALIEPQEDLDAARRSVGSLAARVSAAVE